MSTSREGISIAVQQAFMADDVESYCCMVFYGPLVHDWSLAESVVQAVRHSFWMYIVLVL